MSKNSKEEEKNTKKKGGSRLLPLELKQETKYMIYAIVFFVITLLFILASFGGSGRVGTALHDLGTLVFGFGYFLLPTMTLLIGASFLQTEKQSLPLRNIIGSILFLISGFGIAETWNSDSRTRGTTTYCNACNVRYTSKCYRIFLTHYELDQWEKRKL